MMHSERAQVTGIDLEESALAYARTHYAGPEYLLADVTEHEGEYDWVTSFETLEHLPEPGKALDKFRASRNLICSTPNQERFPFRPESYWGDRFPHLRHYTPRQLDDLLTSSGWTIVKRYCQRQKFSEVSEGTDGAFLVYVCK